MIGNVPEAAGELLRTAPRQERSARRIHLILDTAASLFAEVGYEATTTKHVAERARIAVGSVYHWFPDKAAMASALSERYVESLMQRFEAGGKETPLAALSAFAADHPAFVELLVSCLTRGGPGERLRTEVVALLGGPDGDVATAALVGVLAFARRGGQEAVAACPTSRRGFSTILYGEHTFRR